MKKITLFRLLIIILIVCNFLASYKLENEAAVFIMLWNVLFTLAYIIAEGMYVFDDLNTEIND